jgi:hypothetical protein
VAAEAHQSFEGQGTQAPPSYAFWLWNKTNSDLKINKVTFFFYGDTFVPTAGFVMTPPEGSTYIDLKNGKGQVLPLWPKEDVFPNEIAVLVEIDGIEDIVFSLIGLRGMMQTGYDTRKMWIYQGMNPVQKKIIEDGGRIIHPRYYWMGSQIDIGHGSEIFIGPEGAQEVYYDLGHGEKWYEVRAMTNNGPAQAVIRPLSDFPPTNTSYF